MGDVKIRKCLVNVKIFISAQMFLIITNPVQSKAVSAGVLVLINRRRGKLQQLR